MGDVIERALVNTAIGMGTVFLVLIIIMFVIYAFKIIPVLQKAFSKKDAAPASSENTAKVSVPVAAADDDIPVAAIMAALYAYTEEEGYDGFVVQSIKRRF